MIVCLISSYKEGRLIHNAIRGALDACDLVLCMDGPVGKGVESGENSDFTPFKKESRVFILKGQWISDATKRTAMIEWTRRFDPPVWSLVLDADEAILWPYFVRDYVERAQIDGQHGIKLKLVEMDGSVALAGARLFRADLVEKVLHSGYQFLFKDSGIVQAFPNIPHDEAPLQGEPHILHRSPFRRPGRDAAHTRLSAVEAGWFEEMEKHVGLNLIS